MVYKTPFLKKLIVADYDPAADGTYSWDLSNRAIGAVWITVKGDFVAADQCIDDLLDLIDGIDVWFGGFNVVHYASGEKCMMMNAKLKQNRPMLIGNGSDIDDVMGCSFPILFGAPYLNSDMCLPSDDDNPKSISLTVDIADASFDDLLLDIAEVILPDARPTGFIKQEEVSISALGTGDKDVTLQTNWDLLKLMFHCPTVPVDTAWTTTINRAGLELDDFVFGYQSVPWTILHGEIMDELGGMAGIENHWHTSDGGGHAEDLEEWIRNYGEMDFFHHKNLKWRAPLSEANTAKLKLNLGVDEAFYYIQANYVKTADYMRR